MLTLNSKRTGGIMTSMSTRIDPAVLLSDDPTFFVGNAGGTGLLCRLHRSDPCCGGDRVCGIRAEPASVDASGRAIPTGEPSLDLRVGIDCGFLYYAEGGLANPSDVPALEFLDAALDGRALDALARRWLSERGRSVRAGRRKTDVDLDESDWQPGQPVAWENAYEVLREDNLHDSQGCYSVIDLYFVEPGNDFREVILHFGEGPHGPTREVGGVRLDLKSKEAEMVEMMPERGCSSLLRYLWSRYRRRYPDLSFLESRWVGMREVGIGLQGQLRKRETPAT